MERAIQTQQQPINQLLKSDLPARYQECSFPLRPTTLKTNQFHTDFEHYKAGDTAILIAREYSKYGPNEKRYSGLPQVYLQPEPNGPYYEMQVTFANEQMIQIGNNINPQVFGGELVLQLKDDPHGMIIGEYVYRGFRRKVKPLMQLTKSNEIPPEVPVASLLQYMDQHLTQPNQNNTLSLTHPFAYRPYYAPPEAHDELYPKENVNGETMLGRVKYRLGTAPDGTQILIEETTFDRGLYQSMPKEIACTRFTTNSTTTPTKVFIRHPDKETFQEYPIDREQTTATNQTNMLAITSPDSDGYVSLGDQLELVLGNNKTLFKEQSEIPSEISYRNAYPIKSAGHGLRPSAHDRPGSVIFSRRPRAR